MEQKPQEQLKTTRGLFKWLIFNALTFGIYGLYLIHAIAHDMNIACESDEKKTRGLTLYLLFTVLTIGIYSIVWYIMVCNRMKDKIESEGEAPEVSGLSWFLWSTLGSLLFGIGILVAEYKVLHGLNHVNTLYNRENFNVVR